MIKKEEEFEEFDEGEPEIEEEPKPFIRKAIRPGPVTRPQKEEEEEEEEEEVQYLSNPAKQFPEKLEKKQSTIATFVPKSKPAEPEIQYVAVPRAVTEADMLNNIYDQLAEINKVLSGILEKL